MPGFCSFSLFRLRRVCSGTHIIVCPQIPAGISSLRKIIQINKSYSFLCFFIIFNKIFIVRFFADRKLKEEGRSMDDDYTRELIDQFIKRCKSHGLKITPQRLAIYRELLKLQVHPSADAVYKNVVKEFPTISFDTVNRTLLTFAEIGVVETVESHSGVRRFETDLEPHHHLHCVVCGEIIDFCDSDLDEIHVPARIAEEFTVLGKRVVIRGICRTCAEKGNDDGQTSKGKPRTTASLSKDKA